MSTSVTVESVLKILRQLPLRERLKVVAQVVAEAEEELPPDTDRPRKSMYGLWNGVSVSEEDIDEIRREMWANFPRDDI